MYVDIVPTGGGGVYWLIQRLHRFPWAASDGDEYITIAQGNAASTRLAKRQISRAIRKARREGRLDERP